MIVILHNIRSLHNVGSIFRTADAVGAEKIYLTGITPTPVDRLGRPRPQLAKVSLGAEKTMPWEYVKSASTITKKLKRDGYKIFAIEQDEKAIPYYKIALQLRSGTKNFSSRAQSRDNHIALVVGNEVKGLPPSILKLADKILEIPMSGEKESLNVTVAFGVVVYHLTYAVR